MRPDRVDPRRLYVAIEVVASFAASLGSATSIVYWVRDGHLDPLRLVLLGTIVEVTYFLAQLPTGILADAVSRRLAIIGGNALVGVGWLIEGSSAAFVALAVAQIPIGVGAALTVGAQEAWLASETGDDQLTHVFLRATRLGLVAAVVGAAVAGVAASAALPLPLLLAGGTAIGLSVVLVAVMQEHRPPRTEAAATGDAVVRGAVRAAGRMVRATGTAIVAVRGLVLLLAAVAFVGLWSESFDRLWGDYLLVGLHLGGGRDVVWYFAALAGGAALLGVGATAVAERRLDRLSSRSALDTLVAGIAISAVAVAVMVLTGSVPVVLVAYLLVAGVRPVFAPLTAGWVLPRIPPEVHATSLSAVDLFDSGGQIVGGPIIGAIGTATTARIALLAGLSALAPAVACLVAAGRRITGRPASASGAAPAPPAP